jgi:hypothetical protein
VMRLRTPASSQNCSWTAHRRVVLGTGKRRAPRVPLDIGDHCEPVVGGKLAAVALYIGAEVDALLGGPVHGIAGGTSLAVTRHAVFLVPHLAGGAERVVDPSAASTRELMPAAIASASATPPARATPQLRFTMAPCLLGLSRLIASLGGPLQVCVALCAGL